MQLQRVKSEVTQMVISHNAVWKKVGSGLAKWLVKGSNWPHIDATTVAPAKLAIIEIQEKPRQSCDILPD
jgi:hypothetical protein